jgi:hypothetical protein
MARLVRAIPALGQFRVSTIQSVIKAAMTTTAINDIRVLVDMNQCYCDFNAFLWHAKLLNVEAAVHKSTQSYPAPLRGENVSRAKAQRRKENP